ncbi:MAG: cytochrome c biogenesis protein CcsA [bacterium]|nr:cytochrome c biogenesis protein CcsA [bacterium]
MKIELYGTRVKIGLKRPAQLFTLKNISAETKTRRGKTLPAAFIFSTVLALLLLLPAMVRAAEVSIDHLRSTAILENGRIKPLDTFSQNLMKQFSGRSDPDGEKSIKWLARTLFTPEKSYDDKIFLVTNPEVLDAIGVLREGKARDRYSFSQLKKSTTKLRELALKASKVGDKERSFIENEMISLYNKLYAYQQLTVSFHFLFPHPEFTLTHPETLTLLGFPADGKEFCYFQMAVKMERIKEIVAAAGAKESTELTEAEKEVTALKGRLETWARFYGEIPLDLIPTFTAGTEKDTAVKWLSPWALAARVISGSKAAVDGNLYIIRDFVNAYRKGDQAEFSKAVIAFNKAMAKSAGDSLRENVLSREVLYNRVDPFYKAKFFYGFAVIFLLLSLVGLEKWFYRSAFALLGAGCLLHLWGTIIRMVIMQRPPVTNLYETFVFTGLITAILGIVLEFFKKKNIGILTGGLAGLVMLMIAGKYALDGDTMGMLVAVLDSNFWLASHVITIILGYAGIVLSGFLGHVYILQKLFKPGGPGKKELLDNTFQAVYAIQAFGILFTFLGTVLGGIWADQSWGRFWGWDPKENGALLILLWSAVLFHAKKAGWIRETGMAFGTVIGVIAVSLAWFGVNLLGVGLHTYGFTSGIAKSLFIFIAVESLFIALTIAYMGGRKEKA